MKPIYKIPFIFLIPLAIILYANSSGSPGGRSGSPGDGGATCVQCHTGTASATSGWITSNIPASGYVPGETYQITATGTHSGVVRFGFELTAENTSGGKVGTFTITDTPRTKLINQGNALTHTFNGTTVSGNSSSWSANWTAPGTNIGQIRFYAAFNAANGNGNTSGDVVYTSSLFVEAAQPASLLSVMPDEAEQGSSLELTITGQNTNWSGNSPAVSLRNAANPDETIAASGVNVSTNTSLTAEFAITPIASPGLWDMLVDDLVLANAFTVIEIIPALLSVEPEMGAQGTAVELIITAENTFWSGSDPSVLLQFNGSLPTLIEPVSVSILSNTSLMASFEIPADATLGLYNVVVDELELVDAFTVTIFESIAEKQAVVSKMFPNPASDQVILELNNKATLKVFDMNGGLVLEQQLNAGRETISVGNLLKGVYMLEISTSNARQVKRLVVR